MLSTLILASTLAFADAPLSCAAMGTPVSDTKTAVDYAGVRLVVCCGGCLGPAKKEPAKLLKKAADGGKVVGIGLFDPVEGKKVNAKKAAGTRDFAGVRYYFLTTENMAAFDKEPKKFTVLPAKESLYCAVMEQQIESVDKATGYVDYSGTRYYVCCGGCLGAMKSKPAEYAKAAEKTVQTAKSVDAPKPKE
jgi:YHS domain-containing protein